MLLDLARRIPTQTQVGAALKRFEVDIVTFSFLSTLRTTTWVDSFDPQDANATNFTPADCRSDGLLGQRYAGVVLDD